MFDQVTELNLKPSRISAGLTPCAGKSLAGIFYKALPQLALSGMWIRRRGAGALTCVLSMALLWKARCVWRVRGRDAATPRSDIGDMRRGEGFLRWRMSRRRALRRGRCSQL